MPQHTDSRRLSTPTGGYQESAFPVHEISDFKVAETFASNATKHLAESVLLQGVSVMHDIGSQSLTSSQTTPSLRTALAQSQPNSRLTIWLDKRLSENREDVDDEVHSMHQVHLAWVCFLVVHNVVAVLPHQSKCSVDCSCDTGVGTQSSLINTQAAIKVRELAKQVACAGPVYVVCE